jgi:hypothetical protein
VASPPNRFDGSVASDLSGLLESLRLDTEVAQQTLRNISVLSEFLEGLAATMAEQGAACDREFVSPRVTAEISSNFPPQLVGGFEGTRVAPPSAPIPTTAAATPFRKSPREMGRSIPRFRSSSFTSSPANEN